MAEFIQIPYIKTDSFIDEHEIAFTGFTMCWMTFMRHHTL